MKVRDLFVVVYILATSVTGIRQTARDKKISAAKQVTARSSRQEKLESVNMLLYTRKNLDTPLLLNPDDISTLEPVDTNKETVFLIHGWMCDRKTFTGVKNAYLKNKDMNVVNVEWNQLASNMYTKSRKYVELVGARIAQTADVLIDAGQNPADLHFVGHSLGAHISGIAGSKVTKGKIARITALDAAGPGFTSSGNEEKVDSTDAMFVQVIHANCGVLGFKKPLGHVDFYVNDGKDQPGCSTGDMGICSHMRVIEVFEQSVIDCKSFLAHECRTWKEFSSGNCDSNPTAYVGDCCSNSTRGVYFFKTGSQPPYTL